MPRLPKTLKSTQISWKVKATNRLAQPLKTKKADRPHRTGVAWVLRDEQGRVALVRRPDQGLLGDVELEPG